MKKAVAKEKSEKKKTLTSNEEARQVFHRQNTKRRMCGGKGKGGKSRTNDPKSKTDDRNPRDITPPDNSPPDIAKESRAEQCPSAVIVQRPENWQTSHKNDHHQNGRWGPVRVTQGKSGKDTPRAGPSQQKGARFEAQEKEKGKYFQEA